MKLDVGCGNKPKGDVNVDLYPSSTNHRYSGLPIDTKKVPNFVKADAERLPFRSGAFDVVYSHHVIEHVSNPVNMLRELLRVSRGSVEIFTPHRFARPDNASHRQHFTKTWFAKALRRLGYPNHDIEYSDFSFFPHFFLPVFRLPKEIYIKIRKRNQKEN